VIEPISAGEPFMETDNCIGTLSAGDSYTISVRFKPTATTNQEVSKITDNAKDNPQRLTLSGDGVLGVLSAAPTTLNFGSIVATRTSAPKIVTLTNTGPVAAMIKKVTAPAPFKIAGGVNSSSSKTIAPDKTCSFDVEFAPTSPGKVSAGSIDVT
jgi:hypothetical protein